MKSTQNINAQRRVHCVKDERDRQIDLESKSYAGELMAAAAEILMIAALIRGNSAWRGFLAVALTGCTASLIHKYRQYGERPYLYIGLILGLATLALLITCIQAM